MEWKTTRSCSYVLLAPVVGGIAGKPRPLARRHIVLGATKRAMVAKAGAGLRTPVQNLDSRGVAAGAAAFCAKVHVARRPAARADGIANHNVQVEARDGRAAAGVGLATQRLGCRGFCVVEPHGPHHGAAETDAVGVVELHLDGGGIVERDPVFAAGPVGERLDAGYGVEPRLGAVGNEALDLAEGQSPDGSGAGARRRALCEAAPGGAAGWVGQREAASVESNAEHNILGVDLVAPQELESCVDFREIRVGPDVRC